MLHRRSWTATAAALPQLPPGATESERYLEWQRWRRRHGLPARVFARAYPEGPGVPLGAAKPQYVDFAGPLSLTALDGLLSGGVGRLVLEEMLPGEDALHVRSAQGRHVAELALEVLPLAQDGAAEEQQHPNRPRRGEPNHD